MTSGSLVLALGRRVHPPLDGSPGPAAHPGGGSPTDAACWAWGSAGRR